MNGGQDRDAIVVEVDGKKEKQVYIAMPFDNRFDAAYNEIKDAVLGVGMQPFRVDMQARNNQYLDTIIRQIRASGIVVADCSPEQETGKSNPNVMYEVGLAHSIGKCTILLTNEIDNIPSNLAGYNFVRYTMQNLQYKLQEQLHICENNVTNGLTDARCTEIHVRRDLRLCDDMQECFNKIVSFGYNFNRYMNSNKDKFDGPYARFTSIFFDIYRHNINYHDLIGNIIDNGESWTTYYNYYNNNSSYLDGLIGDSLNDCYRRLRQTCANGNGSIRDSESFYNNIIERYRNYKSLHTMNFAPEQFMENIRDRDKASGLFFRISSIHNSINGLLTYNDMLMHNITRSIISEGGMNVKHISNQRVA